eukprot:TRINITY_DN956_c0_g1_i1.p1 TRINITY_DN956_c0_g1~~TRINITY_DN956_c0_g1_i1.p1  ORF type:complete len:399 (+),score=40.35 TRINITY_DN956_c0_g1_i1:1217-2413(+)
MSPLISLFLFVLIDILGFSLVLPLFPYYTTEYGMSPIEIGLLQTSNAAAQFLAVPVLGSLSDKYGRRPLLIISVFGTLISFIMLALATSPTMLFASRILDGLLGGNISLAQAYIADITTEADRSKGMGLLGAAFGLGFIVGPAVGGTLSKWSHSAPSWLAAGLSLINLIAVISKLPESLPVEKRSKSLTGTGAFLPGAALRESLTNKRLFLTLVLRFGYGVVFTAFEMTFGFFTKLRLGLDARFSSYLLSVYGIVFAGVQAGGMRALTQRYEERGLFVYVLVGLSLFYFLGSLSTSVLQHLAVLVPLGAVSGVSNTLVSSLVSKEVDPTLRGGTLGLSAALGSLTRVVAPVVGTYMVQHSGPSTPGVVCAAICVPLALLAWNISKIPRNSPRAEEKND